MIRPATLKDVDMVVELGLEALNDNAYENMRIDPKKVRKVAIECISGASNFCWVAETGGVVVAAVTVLVHEQLFYERSQASVVQFYSRGHRGQGFSLIKQFLKWARGRRAIKLITFTLEPGADPRIGKLLSRLGLSNELPIYTEVR
jgi:hypothetical protein